MVPGLQERATKIDRQDADHGAEGGDVETIDANATQRYLPKIGDVYQKNDSVPLVQAMVVALKGKNVYLGSDIIVNVDALTDSSKWSYLLNVMDT